MKAGQVVVGTSNPPKVDTQASLGLTTATAGSLAYRVAVVEHHCHSAQQVYGLTSNTMAQKALTPIVVTGGNGAWGTELELHNGATIESGSSTKYFDMNNLMVTAVGTINRVTMLEFYANTLAANVGATTQFGADTVTKNTHGLANGTKVQLNTIASSTNINAYTVYYVVNQAANTFQLSLTVGGAAVDIQTADGTCNYQVVTQTLLTEVMISRLATACDGYPQAMQMDRQLCNTRISCRGWAAGGTNAVSFFLGLHTYGA